MAALLDRQWLPGAQNEQSLGLSLAGQNATEQEKSLQPACPGTGPGFVQLIKTYEHVNRLLGPWKGWCKGGVLKQPSDHAASVELQTFLL